MTVLHALQNTLAWMLIVCGIGIVLFLFVGVVGLALDAVLDWWHGRISRRDYTRMVAQQYPRDHSAEARQLRDVAARMAAREYHQRAGRKS